MQELTTYFLPIATQRNPIFTRFIISRGMLAASCLSFHIPRRFRTHVITLWSLLYAEYFKTVLQFCMVCSLV